MRRSKSLTALSVAEGGASLEKASRAIAIYGGAAALLAAFVWAVARSRRQSVLGRVVETRETGGMLLKHHRGGMDIKERVGLIQDLVWQSTKNPEMRHLALALTGNGVQQVKVRNRVFEVQGAGCPARDGKCEARAIYNWVRKNVRYTGDVAPVKMGRQGAFEAVDLFQGADRTAQFGGGDCLPVGTLLLTDKFELCPIEDLRAGTRIWGRDRWSEVQRVWYKGLRPVDVVTLNTGSTFKATGDHKVFAARCLQHLGQDEGFGCACDMKDREVVRLHVSELHPGVVLVDPTHLPFGTETLNPDRALVEGFYLADGWSTHNSRFDIAGKDGKRKEAQKKEIEEVCARLGVRTTMHERWISILDPEWTLRVHQMGRHAPDKHLLSLNLDEAAAAATLRGLETDADIREGCFSSTSKVLAVQYRVLQKMFGRRCGGRLLADHGGPGQHPVWRITPRRPDEEGWSSKKLLRVREVDREVLELPVYDLTTSDHYVYLPEADVTVSNCDDHSILNATLLALNGIQPKLRVTAPQKGSDWAHIYCLGGVPKNSPKKWLALDTTLPGEYFNVEAPHARERDFNA